MDYSVGKLWNCEKSTFLVFEELEVSNRQLTEALEQIKTLKGMLPICSHCKKIRDDEGYWENVEEYISHHSDARFSHSLCPTCMEELYPDYISSDNDNREEA